MILLSVGNNVIKNNFKLITHDIQKDVIKNGVAPVIYGCDIRISASKK